MSRNVSDGPNNQERIALCIQSVMMDTEYIVPHLRGRAVNCVGNLLEGGGTTGIRRYAIHGRKNNDAYLSNPVTEEHALSSQTSRAKQRTPRSRWDARTKPAEAPSRKLVIH